MKKFFTISLLLCFLAALGLSAKAEEGVTQALVKMTYIDGTDDYVNDSFGAIPAGETAKSGYNKISGGKVELGEKSWSVNYITYLQVDASAVEGNVVKATLTFDGSGSTDSKRVTTWGVGYNSSIWSEDLTWLNADRSITLMGGTQTGTTKSVSKFETYEFDITEAIKNAEGNIATILVYETAAAGGLIKNPVVNVEWSTETPYKVTFAETAGVEAKVTIDGKDVTNGTDLLNGTYEYTASAAGYFDYTGEFTVNGADLEVTFTLEPKAVWNYTVEGVDADGNVLATVASGEGFQEEGVTYHFPGFLMHEGTLYATAKRGTNPWYGVEGALLDENGKVFTQTYGSTVANAIFYKEAEEMEGFNSQDTNNAGIRCSNGLGGNVIDGGDALLTKLPAGTYQITGQVWGTNGLTAGVKVKAAEEGDEDTDLWKLDSTGSLTATTSEEFTLNAETELYVYTTGGTDKRMLDYIYITGTPAIEYTISFNVAEAAGEEDTTPVVGAYVYFSDKEALTDEDGNASFKAYDLWRAGEISYTVYKDGYEPVSGSIEFTESNTEVKVEVLLEQATCTANFKVVDEAGEPVEGAFIEFNGVEVETDENGSAQAIGKGWFGKTFQYTVMKDYLFAEGEIDFTESLEAYEVVTLVAPECTANIIVTDEEGEPVAEALVTIGEEEQLTDEDGKASFTGKWIGTEVDYTVYKDGYEFFEGKLDFSEGDTAYGIAELEPVMCTANFKVMDEEGEPVAEAFIEFNGTELVTDENGSAVAIGKGWFGKTFQYTVMKDYLFAEGEISFTEGIEAYEVVTLEAPVCTATIMVYNEDEEPIEGAYVIVGDQEGTTDENGRVSFTGKWIGTTVEYTVFADGYEAYDGTLDFSEGSEAYGIVNLEIATCTAIFKVIDEEGEPLANAMVTIGEETYNTDETGSVSVTGKGWFGTEVEYTVVLEGYDEYKGVIEFTEGYESYVIVEMKKAIIDGIEMLIENGDVKAYDLNGHRVMRPATGIYIVDGKKVFIRRK